MPGAPGASSPPPPPPGSAPYSKPGANGFFNQTPPSAVGSAPVAPASPEPALPSGGEKPTPEQIDKAFPRLDQNPDGTYPPDQRESQKAGEPVTGFNATHYGYPDDKTPDSNSAKGIGAFNDNKLGPNSVAISDDVAKKLGLDTVRGGGTVELKDSKGNSRLVTYDDRAPENGRIDLYDPTGSEKKGQPFDAVSAIKVSGGKNTAANAIYPKNKKT